MKLATFIICLLMTSSAFAQDSGTIKLKDIIDNPDPDSAIEKIFSAMGIGGKSQQQGVSHREQASHEKQQHCEDNKRYKDYIRRELTDGDKLSIRVQSNSAHINNEGVMVQPSTSVIIKGGFDRTKKSLDFSTLRNGNIHEGFSIDFNIDAGKYIKLGDNTEFTVVTTVENGVNRKWQLKSKSGKFYDIRCSANVIGGTRGDNTCRVSSILQAYGGYDRASLSIELGDNFPKPPTQKVCTELVPQPINYEAGETQESDIAI